MTPELDKSLAGAVEAFKNGVIDVSSQFPDLANQIVAREMVGGWVGVAVAIAIVILALICAALAIKYDNDDFGWSVMAIGLFIISILIGCFNTHTLLICHYAPKTIILQELSRLVH